MTRSKLLIPGVLAVAAAVAFWFLVLSPKREEIAQLDTDIAAQRDRRAQAEQQAVLYAKAKDNYRKNYTTVVRLGKAVPADDDVRSLLVQIDDAASDAKVDFRSVSVSSQAAAPTDPAARGRGHPRRSRPPRAPCPSARPASPPCRSTSRSPARSSACPTSSTT